MFAYPYCSSCFASFKNHVLNNSKHHNSKNKTRVCSLSLIIKFERIVWFRIKYLNWMLRTKHFLVLFSSMMLCYLQMGESLQLFRWTVFTFSLDENSYRLSLCQVYILCTINKKFTCYFLEVLWGLQSEMYYF